MFTVIINDEEFRIHFHSKVEVADLPWGDSKMRTYATLSRPGEEEFELVEQVSVTKYYQDRHNRALAQKYALTKLLRTGDATLVFNSVDYRALVWASFFGSSKARRALLGK